MKVALSHQVPIDALPYVDPYNEAMKRQVDELVQAEMRKFVPPNYLAQLPPPPVPNFQVFSINTIVHINSHNFDLPFIQLLCIIINIKIINMLFTFIR